MTSKARRVIRELFEALLADVALMPERTPARGAALRGRRRPSGRARGVADYIAGMTDRFAILEHARLFDPAERT